MTFWRRLAAAGVLVAAVVALGVAWEHSSEARWITPPGPGHGPAKMVVNGTLAHPPGTVVQPNGTVFRQRGRPAGLGLGLNFSDTGNLTRTAEIEAAVVAGVVLLDVIRRRQRRARRTPAERRARRLSR